MDADLTGRTAVLRCSNRKEQAGPEWRSPGRQEPGEDQEELVLLENKALLCTIVVTYNSKCYTISNDYNYITLIVYQALLYLLQIH